MTTPKVGDRVRVAIKVPEDWNLTAYGILQGQTGIVAHVKTHEVTGYELPEPRVLVDFDPALPPLWSSASPCLGHWFDASEVVGLGGDS